MSEEAPLEALVIEDLGGQVARLSVEASYWRQRAMRAEETLAAIKAEAEAEVEETDGEAA